MAHVTRSNTYNIDPRLLVIRLEENGRDKAPSKEAIQAKAESMASVGQLQPIKVRREGKDLVVVFGYTRTLGAIHGIETGILPPDFKIRYEVTDIVGKEALLANIAENAQHNSLTPLDYAHNMKRLIEEFGMSQNEVCKALGKSRSWGTWIADLMKSNPWIQSLVHEGKMTLECCHLVASTEETLSRKVLDHLTMEELDYTAGNFKHALRKFSGGAPVAKQGRGKKKAKGSNNLRRSIKEIKEIIGHLASIGLEGRLRETLSGLVDGSLSEDQILSKFRRLLNSLEKAA